MHEAWLDRALRAAGETLLRVSRNGGVVVTLLWAVGIWALSSVPGPPPRPTPFLWAVLSNLAHAPLFGLFAACLALTLPRVRGWPVFSPGSCAFVVALVIAYGVMDEVHQGFTPDRSPSALDVVTDAVGAVCTLWVAAGVASGVARAPTGMGLRGRLAVGVVACVTSAALATALPRLAPGIAWL